MKNIVEKPGGNSGNPPLSTLQVLQFVGARSGHHTGDRQKRMLRNVKVRGTR